MEILVRQSAIDNGDRLRAGLIMDVKIPTANHGYAHEREVTGTDLDDAEIPKGGFCCLCLPLDFNCIVVTDIQGQIRGERGGVQTAITQAVQQLPAETLASSIECVAFSAKSCSCED